LTKLVNPYIVRVVCTLHIIESGFLCWTPNGVLGDRALATAFGSAFGPSLYPCRASPTQVKKMGASKIKAVGSPAMD